LRPLLKADRARIDRATDLLGQVPALETLEAAIRRVPTPACVAVYGPWGSGKTTLMHSAHTGREAAGAPTLWFDPWPYERGQDVIGPLIHTLLRSLDGDPERMDRARKLAIGVAKALVDGALRIGGAYALGDPKRTLSRLSPRDFEKYFTKWASTPDSVHAVRKRFRALVDFALEGHGPDARYVVHLDDLDRCLPDSVVELIEAVKLLMCGDPNTRAVFVFALDRQIVGEAIRQRYPGATGFTGENYLEKIFDLALEVPPVDEMNVKQYVVRQLSDDLDRLTAPFASPGRPDGLGLLLEVLALPMFANPRVITRVLNRLDLLLANADRLAAITAVDDVSRLRRWLLWIAGAERYRGFRYYMRRASDPELRDLQNSLTGASSALSPEGRLLLDSPGFRRFMGELFKSVQLSAELKRTPGGRLSTLVDFDRLLRSAGL
jgi:hypothetical protein